MSAVRSDALVFFGATGDLAYKKIFPALQAMAKRGHVSVPVIGVAKAGWNLEQLRARARNLAEMRRARSTLESELESRGKSLAQLAREVTRRRREFSGTAKAVAWFLVAVHAVIAPLALPLRAAHPIGPTWVEARLHVRLPRQSLEGRTVVVVNAPSAIIANYLVLRREMDGLSVPRHMRVLAPAIPSVTIRRLDERTLAIAPEGGYLRFPLDKVFRNEIRGFKSGDQVKLTGMTVTIDSLTADGRPAEATFRFDVPLESSCSSRISGRTAIPSE